MHIYKNVTLFFHSVNNRMSQGVVRVI